MAQGHISLLDFTDQISVSMWLYSSGQSNSFQVLLTWCFAYCSAYSLLDGFLSKDSTKKLQMPWDPGLQNLHRVEGESIFKEGRMLGTLAHCV
jgi:hypothetical protein